MQPNLIAIIRLINFPNKQENGRTAKLYGRLASQYKSLSQLTQAHHK